ncbi:M48 family metalloprotease [Streptomyces sp. NPDC056796]|uniref:M48 family metalloprotease n=1 Tax=unclassified Streptomyces TaxID=2593676 RepID=UPI0036B1E3D9
MPLLLPFLLAPAANRVMAWARPATALWILTAGATALAVAGVVSLGALSLTGLLLIPAFARLGELVHPLCTPSVPLVVTWAVLASGTLAFGACALGRAALRHGRSLRAAHRQAASLPLAGDLCVIDSPHADAYALPGRQNRIVVTTAMLRSLEAAEREVLFAHERAHNAGRHHYFLAFAEVAAHCHPALRAVRTSIRLSVERAADEAAADAVGDRRLAARAVARAALAGRDSRGSTRPYLAPGVATGPVPRRVTALLRPPSHSARRPRVLAVAVAVAALLSTGVTVAGVVHMGHEVGEARGEVAR